MYIDGLIQAAHPTSLVATVGAAAAGQIPFFFPTRALPPPLPTPLRGLHVRVHQSVSGHACQTNAHSPAMPRCPRWNLSNANSQHKVQLCPELLDSVHPSINWVWILIQSWCRDFRRRRLGDTTLNYLWIGYSLLLSDLVISSPSVIMHPICLCFITMVAQLKCI